MEGKEGGREAGETVGWPPQGPRKERRVRREAGTPVGKGRARPCWHFHSSTGRSGSTLSHFWVNRKQQKRGGVGGGRERERQRGGCRIPHGVGVVGQQRDHLPSPGPSGFDPNHPTWSLSPTRHEPQVQSQERALSTSKGASPPKDKKETKHWESPICP